MSSANSRRSSAVISADKAKCRNPNGARGRGNWARLKKGQYVDLVGQRFNRLVVVSYAGKHGGTRLTTWNCLCDCGETCVVMGTNLKNRHVQSCGCLRREQGKEIKLKHGHAAGGVISPEYRTWQGIRTRCNNPKEPSYPRYGGRGIRICDRWNGSFEAFLADVGPKPSPKHSLGRIDNDGHYEPSNVRWETPLEQGANNSRNRNFTIDGRTMHLTAWCRERNLVLNTVHRRLKRGMSIEAALEIDTDPDSQERRNAILSDAIVRRLCQAPELSWDRRAEILGPPWSATTLRRHYGN